MNKDFPLLRERQENGHRLVYLDNAATTQKPQSVIDAVDHYYKALVANPHRGAYALSAEATEVYENAREKTASFIGAASAEEIIFTRNATDSLNLVALSYAMGRIDKEDEILVAISEHHSNLLPWQQISRKTGAKLTYLYTDETGRITVEELRSKLNAHVKLVAIGQISNVLGTINPIRELAQLTHENGAVFVMDGAQSVPHIKVNVQELDVDFMAFSAHKMLGPDGIGVLYGKKELLEQMEPVVLGGGIVEEVTEHTVRYLTGPSKFEPGTPNVEGAAGLAAAIAYLENVGLEEVTRKEMELTQYLLEKMEEVPGVKIYGSTEKEGRMGIVAFNLKNIHPHDVASILDADGVAVRAGHHCAQPLMNYLGIHSCCRVSLYLYNTKEDVDQFIASLRGVERWLS